MKQWVVIGILAGLLAAACGTRRAHEGATGATFLPLGGAGYGVGSSHTNWLGPTHPSGLHSTPRMEPDDQSPGEDEEGDSGPEFLMPRHKQQVLEI